MSRRAVRPASGLFSPSTVFANSPWIRASVCSGWRRSWLAAARKRDLATLASSACRLAASSASAVCFRSVMSAKVMTTPSTPLSWVRYGKMRRMYQAPLSRLDLPLDRREGLQHRSGIRQKSAIGSQRVEVGERPPDIARDDVEERSWSPA